MVIRYASAAPCLVINALWHLRLRHARLLEELGQFEDRPRPDLQPVDRTTFLQVALLLHAINEGLALLQRASGDIAPSQLRARHTRERVGTCKFILLRSRRPSISISDTSRVLRAVGEDNKTSARHSEKVTVISWSAIRAVP